MRLRGGYSARAMKRLAPLLLCLGLLAPEAFAQEQPAQDGERAGGRLVLRVASGIPDGDRIYVARGQTVELRGAVSDFAAGQYADVTVTRRGRRVLSQRVLIRKDGEAGRFRVRFRARRTGTYRIRAFHASTSEQRELFARASVDAVTWSAGPGARGVRVRVLQRGLARLAFVTSRGGRYDAATGRAVLAFRKTNGMARVTSAGREVFSMLLRGRGGYRLKYPDHGKHVEADLSRQVLVLARDGRPERIYHTASGAPATPTVMGSFRFYRKQPGRNSHGMLHSNYFIRGYAIHGYPSVPPHPASHGCLRVPNANALEISRWIRLGDRIDVYR
jgi:hypothetical protein